MKTVTKEAFEAFLAQTPTHTETDIDGDGEFAYELWTNANYDEVAQIIYSGGRIVGYQIAN